MQIKRLIILPLLSLFPFMSYAYDGTINFTGSIIDTACTVDTLTQDIPLGQISEKSLDTIGASSAPTKFTITLSACPTATSNASVVFDGIHDPNDNNLLALNSGQTAKGIAVGIYEEDTATLIPLATHSAVKKLVTTTGNVNHLNYIAKYQAVGAIKAGSANATATFTVIYN